jgi:hypothetical protein
LNIPSLSGISLSSAAEGEKAQIAVLLNCKDNHPEELKLSLTLNFLDDFIYPLIVHLAHDRKIGSDFGLHRAHILMYEEESRNIILLNENVRFYGHVKLDQAGYKQGDKIMEKNVLDIYGLYPEEYSDRDAAHVMILKLNRKWYFSASFLYNRGKAQAYLEKSKNYLGIAKKAFEDGDLKLLFENLLESIILSAGSMLTMLRYGNFSVSNYDEILSVFRTYSAVGNIDTIYPKTLEKVFDVVSKFQKSNISKDINSLVSTGEVEKILLTSHNLLKNAEALKNAPNVQYSIEGEIISFGTSTQKSG